MSSYLTEDEVVSLQDSGLHKRAVFAICGVSQTIFSIARHYGGAEIQGERFTYFPEHDELIRDDVLKFIRRQRAKTAKPKRRS